MFLHDCIFLFDSLGAKHAKLLHLFHQHHRVHIDNIGFTALATVSKLQTSGTEELAAQSSCALYHCDPSGNNLALPHVICCMLLQLSAQPAG